MQAVNYNAGTADVKQQRNNTENYFHQPTNQMKYAPTKY